MTRPQNAAFSRACWRTSSHSTGQTDCVEMAQAGDTCAVRDSKNRDAAWLCFAAEAWQRFTSEIKNGAHRA